MWFHASTTRSMEASSSTASRFLTTSARSSTSRISSTCQRGLAVWSPPKVLAICSVAIYPSCACSSPIPGSWTSIVRIWFPSSSWNQAEQTMHFNWRAIRSTCSEVCLSARVARINRDRLFHWTLARLIRSLKISGPIWSLSNTPDSNSQSATSMKNSSSFSVAKSSRWAGQISTQSSHLNSFSKSKFTR